MRAFPWVVILFAFSSLAYGADTLAKELQPLEPFIGKTWKAHFKNSTPEKPRIDVAKGSAR
jgi:hypothetical protein